MRPFRFALHLREFGWAPTILTIGAPGQRMTPKEKRLLRDIEIIEIRPPFDWTTSSESQLATETHSELRPDTTNGSTSQPGSLPSGSSFQRRKKGVSATIVEALDRQFPTDTWLLLFAAKYRQLLSHVRRVQPDVLWCTGDPWSGLVAARQLAKHFNIPWVADFRDPWTLSELRSKGQWAVSRRADAYFERKIIESANVVVFQAAGVAEAYRRLYDDIEFESRLIPNSFDPDVFDDPATFTAAPGMPSSPGDGLHIGFFGRFRSMSPASLIIDALTEVRMRDPALSRRMYVHSFGLLNDEDAFLAEERGVRSSFIRETAVPLEMSLAVLRGFDLLLVSTESSRDHIIPAKLFEYLAAGRPILSLSRNPEVGSILQQSGTGIQLDPFKPKIVADLLVACLDACDQGGPLPIPFDPNAAAISRFEARETTRLLALVFDEVTQARV